MDSNHLITQSHSHKKHSPLTTPENMPEVLESRTHASAASRTLRCGVKPSPVQARETSGSSGGVGYRLRQADDLIRTGSAFAATLTLVIMMASSRRASGVQSKTTCSAG
jgi:hypothetical protein